MKKIKEKDIEDAYDALTELKTRYLKQKGWDRITLVCSTWYWVKKIKGSKLVASDIDDAVKLQEDLDWKKKLGDNEK